MLTFLGVVAGIALLILGGALLVRGASAVASGMGVSPMVIGLTIVGFGTSSPELVVNVIGALNGETAIAFGNVVGSNISNLGLVLGSAALLGPIAIRSGIVRKELPLLLLATTMITVMALDQPLEGQPSMISRTDSLALLLVFGIFLYIIVLDFLKTRNEDILFAEINQSPMFSSGKSGLLSWVMVVAGFGLLFFGGELTIRSGTSLAEQLGVSPTVIGLFVVAIGTSMPELVTSIIAAFKGESDLALGNVIGSNIFNSLMVLPISGTIANIAVPEGGVNDLVVSWVFAAVLVPIFFFSRATLGRPMGFVFLIAYFSYAVWRINS
jgi:cation:H+ antiporter